MVLGLGLVGLMFELWLGRYLPHVWSQWGSILNCVHKSIREMYFACCQAFKQDTNSKQLILMISQFLSMSRYKSSDRYSDGGGRDRYKNNSSDSYHGRSHQFGGYHGDREGGHRSEWSGDYHRSEFRHYSREQPGSYQRQHNGWKQGGWVRKL